MIFRHGIIVLLLVVALWKKAAGFASTMPLLHCHAREKVGTRLHVFFANEAAPEKKTEEGSTETLSPGEQRPPPTVLQHHPSSWS
jgi:hypothetical protein